jgi:hypothetical protein
VEAGAIKRSYLAEGMKKWSNNASKTMKGRTVSFVLSADSLTEYPRLQQIPGQGFRRLYYNDDFDLYVWYNRKANVKRNRGAQRSKLVGFQLCYDKGGDERALTWRINEGLTHKKVEEDRDGGKLARGVSILVADGEFDFKTIARKFRIASSNIDPTVSKLIRRVLCIYGKTNYRATCR